VVPVSDVTRAKAFYAEKLGFDVDHDTKISEEYHVVQLTPPGSGCSIVVGRARGDDARLAQGPAAGGQGHPRGPSQLVERGVEVGEVQVSAPRDLARPGTGRT
jgi:catechol 2,3-dioxygenase-like lactoylglutathione lyase family enzyme